MAEEQNCGNCRHFTPVGLGNIGSCVRFPPTTAALTVSAFHRCGEHAPREDREAGLTDDELAFIGKAREPMPADEAMRRARDAAKQAAERQRRVREYAEKTLAEIGRVRLIDQQPTIKLEQRAGYVTLDYVVDLVVELAYNRVAKKLEGGSDVP